MPVSKKGVAYRPLRAFSVRVAVFCALGVYNLTSRRAMRSVCWLAALALAALTLMCSCRPFALARGSLCALAPPQAAGCKLLRPCLSARPPSFAACCLLRSRLARFALRMMYAPAVRSPLPVAPYALWLLRRQEAANSSVRACRHDLRRCRLLPAP